MSSPSSHGSPGNRPSRTRWFVLLACLALVAAGLVIGAKMLIGRGEAPLAQPVLTAPPPLTGTPTPLPDPEYGSSAAPISHPAKVADQQPRPGELEGGWKILPDEPELLSDKAPVVYSDGGVGTLMVQWAPSPAGKTLFTGTMKWTENHGTVVCGREVYSDVLTCAFPTVDGGSLTVKGRGTTLEPLARATQDLQKQLPAGS